MSIVRGLIIRGVSCLQTKAFAYKHTLLYVKNRVAMLPYFFLKMVFVGSTAQSVFLEVARKCKNYDGQHESLIVAIQPPRNRLSWHLIA
jgi:hypothetical protein